jgi:hypothetical protein
MTARSGDAMSHVNIARDFSGPAERRFERRQHGQNSGGCDRARFAHPLRANLFRPVFAWRP